MAIVGDIFGNWLAQWRKDHGLTAAALSRLTGIKPNVLCDIERGRKRPSRAQAEILSSIPEMDAPFDLLEHVLRHDKAGLPLTSGEGAMPRLFQVREILARMAAGGPATQEELEAALALVEEALNKGES